ncbi:uncharacterized protein BKA78DRAFT_72138 [Phyllosticta capitalensis]|uniref:uncharacterized protein n=1 Tax=Phyllosticta capitalensis TaxID=121624 RepID=UPI00312E2684
MSVSMFLDFCQLQGLPCPLKCLGAFQSLQLCREEEKSKDFTCQNTPSNTEKSEYCMYIQKRSIKRPENWDQGLDPYTSHHFIFCNTGRESLAFLEPDCRASKKTSSKQGGHLHLQIYSWHFSPHTAKPSKTPSGERESKAVGLLTACKPASSHP